MYVGALVALWPSKTKMCGYTTAALHIKGIMYGTYKSENKPLNLEPPVGYNWLQQTMVRGH